MPPATSAALVWLEQGPASAAGAVPAPRLGPPVRLEKGVAASSTTVAGLVLGILGVLAFFLLILMVG